MIGWLAMFAADVRQAFRLMRRAPGLATVVIGSIAIGIGANATVFSWMQSRVLHPIPGVLRSGDLLFVEPRGENGSYPGMSWPEYRDVRDRVGAFEDLIAFRIVPFNVGAVDWAERTPGMLVSANYFAGLRLTAAAGRLIGQDDEGREAPIVVISHDYWQSRFSGSAHAVGQTLRVNDRVLTIVGVAPPGFRGSVMGLTFDLWLPAELAPSVIEGSRELTSRGSRGYAALGRLASGSTRAGAQRQVSAAMDELARVHPGTNAAIGGEVLALWQSPRGPQRFMMAALALLQATMLLVLLAVCGNTANLMLARASARRREIAVRTALGAGRARILSLVLTEGLVLALMGALLGAGLATWGTDALRAVPMPTPGGFTIRFDTAVDALTLAFALALGVLSGFVFALPPALQLAGVRPQAALRTGVSPAGRSRLRDVLMLVEVALALVVLTVAALFVKSFNDTQATDPGFRRDGVLLAAYDLRGRRVSVAPAQSLAFASRVLDRVRALPDVESAAIATSVPLDIHGIGARVFTVEGRARTDGRFDQATANTVTPGYFRTMGIPFRAGRDFADLGDPSAPAQVVVNETFVRQFLPDLEPIGRRLDAAGASFFLTGVVADSLYNAFGEPPTPAMYFSYRDRTPSSGEIHVRVRGGEETAVAPAIRRVVRELDPALPLYNLRTLDTHVDTNLVFRRIPARMFVVLGPLLLVLAATGIYAVVAYTVSQRTSEIGMRLALGATGGRVVGDLVIETLRVVAVGAAAGWVVSWLISRDLPQGGTAGLSVLVGVPALLLAVAAFACWVPAHRASRVDPVAALRDGG